MKKRDMSNEAKGTLLIGVTLLFNLLYTLKIIPTNLTTSALSMFVLACVHICILLGFTISIQLKVKEMIFFSILALTWLIYITTYGFL